MGEKKYLIDSNVAIDYLAKLLPTQALEWLDKLIEVDVNLSVINKIEILSFQTDSAEEMALLIEFTGALELLGINDEIVNQTIEIRRKYKVKLPDAIIAATAIVYGLTLLSRNEKDFKKIDGLQFQNPYEITE
ncbi:MAG: type II toxin-antitoxin system VapC family toxin [Saprospiraceae bacterium]